MNNTVTPDPDDSLAPATEELVFRVIRQQETDVNDLLEQFPDASEILRNASRYLFGELTASLPTAEQVPDASGNTTLPRRPEGPSEPADEIGRLERGRGQEICRRFETDLERGLSPRIEDCVSDVAEPQRSALLSMLLAAELRFRVRRGEQLTLDEYLHRFREHRELIEAVFAGVVGPERIGPFVVLRFLGGGNFGRVYLCRDEQLDRLVAIKVPRPETVLRRRRTSTDSCRRRGSPPGSSTRASSRFTRSIATRTSVVSSFSSTSRAGRSRLCCEPNGSRPRKPSEMMILVADATLVCPRAGVGPSRPEAREHPAGHARPAAHRRLRSGGARG